MNRKKLDKLLRNLSGPKTFFSLNFGCRTNAAETNRLSQIFLDQGFSPIDPAKSENEPSLICVNTCAITAKAERQSLQKIRSLRRRFPDSLILATGCADLSSLKKDGKTVTFDNRGKRKLLERKKSAYRPQIGDKFSSSRKYILGIQKGCNQFCTYCIVPHRRPKPWSLDIKSALKMAKTAVKTGYRELIITGVNLDLYSPGLSSLVKTLLEKTSVKKISFGSVPVNSLTPDLLNLFRKDSQKRLSRHLHIPIQSGSDKILKLMNRPYTRQTVVDAIGEWKEKIPGLTFGTDIIVGFPGEEDRDFQKTVSLCRKINFKKIHTFRYSPRPGTPALLLRKKFKEIPFQEVKRRSQTIRSLAQK